MLCGFVSGLSVFGWKNQGLDILMSELKPCPFCGGSNVFLRDYDPNNIWIECDDCQVGTLAIGWPECVVAWNTRATLDDPVETGWMPIETAPERGEFLAYGFYIYAGDTSRTQYQSIAWRSGNPEWPWEDTEGQHPANFFSHWMPLPDAPK